VLAAMISAVINYRSSRALFLLCILLRVDVEISKIMNAL
jgi:hypothetical protein